MTYIYRWNEVNITAAVNRFFTENNRHPIVEDFDTCDYLPTSRTIQRQFGGVKKLREKLGQKVLDYSRGKHRAAIARTIQRRSLEAENIVGQFLVGKFGRPSVHYQPPLSDDFRARADFAVYSPSSVFYVDVLSSYNLKSSLGSIRQKLKKYWLIKEDKVYFVEINPNLALPKDLVLPSNIQVISWSDFQTLF